MQTPNSEKRVEKAKITLEKLSNSHVYNVANDEAFKQLLWLNVTEYNRLNAQNVTVSANRYHCSA